VKNHIPTDRAGEGNVKAGLEVVGYLLIKKKRGGETVAIRERVRGRKKPSSFRGRYPAKRKVRRKIRRRFTLPIYTEGL